MGVSFNQDMLGTFLNLKGGLLFLLLFFGAAALVYYEYSGMLFRISPKTNSGIVTRGTMVFTYPIRIRGRKRT